MQTGRGIFRLVVGAEGILEGTVRAKESRQPRSTQEMANSQMCLETSLFGVKEDVTRVGEWTPNAFFC